jgi:hypothetical protein
MNEKQADFYSSFITPHSSLFSSPVVFATELFGVACGLGGVARAALGGN